MAPNTEKYNEDEMEAPEWMDSLFLTKVLGHCERSSNVVVESFKISPASVKGDHYASVMFRAHVEYSIEKGALKEKSLIIKTMPDEGKKKELLEESKIFETEIGMYSKVLPDIQRILRDAGDEIQQLGAPCIYHSLNPRKIIVFEDLVPEGYAVMRNRSITLEEAKAAYSKLAKMQAVSYKILKERPEYFKDYRYGMLTLEQWTEAEFFKEGINHFTDLLKSQEDLHGYINYFESQKPGFLEKLKGIFVEYPDKMNEESIYVLCHGDFHVKNMMFKHHPQSGKFEDLILLDFQLSSINPIVNDLIYSFYLLIDSDLRPVHIEELIFEYHRVFKETLLKIGFKGTIPKLQQITQQMLHYKKWEFFILSTFLPMWMKFKTGDIDVEQLMRSAEYRNELYKNPEYLEEIRRLLLRFQHKGYFED